tara:strand:+ start:105 stop:386 length:282 start_codon:yes stop_codon:yes gene_type:complete
MKKLLRGPRRVLLTLLGVKRRRRYSSKNKYVAMLLNHDKQLQALNTRCNDLTKVDSNMLDCMDNERNKRLVLSDRFGNLRIKDIARIEALENV